MKEKEVTLENGDKVAIYVKKPTNDVISAADMYRAKVWNNCITDGVITKKELSVLMEERGIWSKDKTKQEDQLSQEIQELERSLYRGKRGQRKPKVSEGKNIAFQMRDLRIKLRDLIGERLGLEENTAESLADNARFDYFVSQCTFYKDTNERVYNSLEEYNSKSSDNIAFTAASLLGEMLYNLDDSFESNLPENKWLKAFNIVDQDLQLRNVDGELVDRDGKLVNEFGHFLNEKGERVDADGLPLNDDGSYKMVEYENDLEVEKPKPKPKRKTRAKKTEANKPVETES